jgi:integrase
MKKCHWCEKDMKSQNFNKHSDRCFYKNKIGATKQEIDIYLKKRPREEEEKEKFPVAEYEMLKTMFKKIDTQMTKFKENFADDFKNPIDVISEMSIADSTKRNYMSEWRQFEKYARVKKLGLGASAANSYIASNKCSVSTKLNKKNIMQAILRSLYGNDTLKLSPIRQKHSIVPKFTLSDEEVKLYLNEQKNLGDDLYWAQLLMVIYGLRVSSVAALQRKHLEFMDSDKNQIVLPDVKTKRLRVEEADEDLQNILTQYAAGLDDEDYMFYREGNDKALDRRSQHFCLEINKRLADTKAFRKSKNFKYTSHMFRKTRANKEFQEGVKELKQKARLRIGQGDNSSAIDKYLDN